MWLVSQLVVNVYLTFDVAHEIFFDYFLDTHTFENYYALSSNVTSDCNHADHATSDQSAQLVLSDLSVNCSLLLLFQPCVSQSLILVLLLVRRSFSVDCLFVDLLLRCTAIDILIISLNTSSRQRDRSLRLILIGCALREL